MNAHAILLALLLSAQILRAQVPLNDDCAGLIDLGEAPACPTTVFSNVGATNSDIGFDNTPSCFNGGVPSRDVWFKFTCPDTLFEFRLTLTGVGNAPIENPQIAIYRGACEFDGLAELRCAIAPLGEHDLYMDLTGLTPGLEYFIRVSDYSATAAPQWGDFTLCVDKIPPILTIDGTGSTLCAGSLADSGGPDGDYSSGEDYEFAICPPAPTGCLTFTLEYYNLDYMPLPFPENGFDYLAFFDGPDSNSPLIAQINGQPPSNLTADGGGGVCFKVEASSGCMTVAFHSDSDVEFEGFLGHWQCSDQPCAPKLNIALDTNATATSIVNTISTPFTTVSVTNIDCPSNAYGTFQMAGDPNDLGLSKGLILTTGRAALAAGPNTADNATADNQTDGDNDLDQLSINGVLSHDACVVELDVFVATDELAFEYVLGSEEYPEYANQDYNDIFAFLVSGPGIVGDPGLSNNAKNIAILPSLNQPVSINTVNNLVNWEFYRNNQLGQTLQYDGFTSDKLGIKKSLTARTPVIPCNTYHLKLAVADRFDNVYDSGVFISEIRGGTPDVALGSAINLDYLIESCSGDQETLVFSISDVVEEDLSFNVLISGTATQGIDYLANIPGMVTIPAGQQFVSFQITPLADALAEGTETIVIALTNDFGCGTVVYKTVTIELKDNVDVSVNSGADTVFVCPGGTVEVLANGASDYFWQPPGSVSNPFIANPTITPAQDLWLTVTGTVGTCSDVDSIFAKIINPVVDVSALGPPQICVGGSVALQATNNVNNTGLQWQPTTGLASPQQANTLASPTQTTTYFASVSLGGCTVRDSVVVSVDTLFVPQVNSFPTPICQNYPVQLANNIQSTSTYAWSPAAGLDNPNISGPMAAPAVSTTYSLTVTSDNGYCSQIFSVPISITPADLDVAGDFLQKICLGDTVSLSATVNPTGTPVQWSPPFGLSTANGLSTLAFPDESTTYIASYKANGCDVRDSVRVQVDSLPESTIRRQPDKAIYCPGDTILLFSKTYEPANFPQISIQWLPGGGEMTPDSLWNLFIRAQETHTYQRIVQSGACVDTADVLVTVGKIPEITIDPSLPRICPGESVQINVSTQPSDVKIMWQSAPGLSCTDCKNPIANPGSTTTYNLQTPEEPCPSGASVTVEVLPGPRFNLPGNTTLCPGQSILLNNVTDPGTTYNWTTVPPSGFTSTDVNPTVTPAESTTYNVEAVTSNGCEGEATVLVTVARATLEAGADLKICRGASANLTAATTGTPGNIEWPSIPASGNSVAVSPLQTAVYQVVYIYGNSCILRDSQKVTVLDAPRLDSLTWDPDSLTLCLGTPATFRVWFTPSSGLDLTWVETVGDVATILPEKSATLKTVAKKENVSQSIAVSATNADGCETTAPAIEFDVIRCFELPNVFTPGSAPLNESFGLVETGGEVEVLEFKIYSRWGQKVFDQADGAKTWDGKIGNSDAPMDVYIYTIRVKLPDGREIPFHGDVTLLR